MVINEFGEYVLTAHLTIDKDTFDEMFSGCVTYDDYINHPSCTPGWKAIFDKLKDDGVLN